MDSPHWGANIKLIVGLTLVAVTAGFLIRFSAFIPLILLTIILIYLLRPLIEKLSKATRLSWRWSVNIVFILLVIILLTAFTLTGVAVVQQFQSLINVIQGFFTDLPELIQDFSTQVYVIGPFQIDVSQYLSTANLESLAQELIGVVQPMLGRAGSLLGTIASGTATTFGGGFLIVMLSYFILVEMVEVPEKIVQFELPGYDADIRRIGVELSRIWNAFLRGQIIMFVLTVLVYTVVYAVLGVRYTLALALLAGVGRFVPYIGQWINWIVLVLVIIFQKGNYFGLETLQYTILVVAIVFVIDTTIDNFVSPRILGRSIGVHPAAVLFAAIISFSLLGIVGVVLAAPGLASLNLIGRYIARKMLDRETWPEPESQEEELAYPWVAWIERLRTWGQKLIEKIRDKRSG
jgi:predicted PurR-regulated permease PerM